MNELSTDERVASFLASRFGVPIQWADVDDVLALLAAHPVQDDCLDTLPIRERDAWVAATLRFMRDRGYTITAPGRSVQDEASARAYFGEGYEFALIHLDDEPVQADLARLRPDRPVRASR